MNELNSVGYSSVSSSPLITGDFAAARIQRWVRSRMNGGSYGARLHRIETLGHQANQLRIVPLPKTRENRAKLSELQLLLWSWIKTVDDWIGTPPPNKRQKSDRSSLLMTLIDAQSILPGLLEMVQTNRENDFLLIAAYDLQERVQAVAAVCLDGANIEILVLCSAPSNLVEEGGFRGGATAILEEICYANRFGDIVVAPTATAEGFYKAKGFIPGREPRSEFECQEFVLRNSTENRAIDQFLATNSGYAVPTRYFLGNHPILRLLRELDAP